MIFTWTEADLNPEQSEAVRLTGSLFLVACPGSGKTRTLTYKIAYELSRLESMREYVVAITYTHRAADEIRERIEDLGVDTTQLWIGTIHSFCLEWILKPYKIYEPRLAHGFRIIDQHERETVLKRLCEPHSASRVTFWDCDYYFIEGGYVLGCPDATKHPIIHQVLTAYFQELDVNHQIDFELILWHANSLIRNHPQISNLLSKLFKIILVDEYQDTKAIQYTIITSILRAGEGSTQLFMVGDPNQAIYGSLGGYPIALDELMNLSRLPIEQRALSQNYRSSARLISYFSNFNVHQTAIEAAGNERGYPSLITYDHTVNRNNLVGEIVSLIKYNIETLRIPPHEICVLAPQWVHLATMTRQLVVQMPEYQFDGPGMAPFARDIENFWYKVARLALTEAAPSLYVRRLRWASEIINELKDSDVDTTHLTRKSLLRICNSININEVNGLTFLGRFFDELFGHLEIAFHDVAHLEEHHQAFFDSTESRIARLEAEGMDGIGDIEFFKKVFQNRSGITVSTIHGVKGAEFDVVIAYALLDGMVPHFNDANGDTSAQKLLYVVGSRSRKNLHLFSETERPRGRYYFYSPTVQLSNYHFDYDEVNLVP